MIKGAEKYNYEQESLHVKSTYRYSITKMWGILEE